MSGGVRKNWENNRVPAVHKLTTFSWFRDILRWSKWDKYINHNLILDVRREYGNT